MATYSYNLAAQPLWQSWQQVTVNSNPVVYPFTVDTSGDIITVTGSSRYFTGKPVLVSSTGALPSPLTFSTPYYIIYVTDTTFKLATSYANAIIGTAINLTTAGTGILSIFAAGQAYLVPNANGYIATYSSQDHSQYKATFTDWTGNTSNPNPIPLDNKGQATIYWQVNDNDSTDNYYIEEYDANGTLLDSRDNFNAAEFGSNHPSSLAGFTNFVRNNCFYDWQLYDWNNLDVSVTATVMPTAGFIETATEWFFTKNNNNATDIISRETFEPGQIDVPGNPVYYMRMACTNAGAGGETYKYAYQDYDNAQTFNGENITLTFYAKSSSNNTALNINAEQYFGSGGSATVLINGATNSLTTNWAIQTVTLNVPSISGKTVNAGSYFRVKFNPPLNSTYQIDFSSMQITAGSTAEAYVQTTVEQQLETLTVDGNTGDVKIHMDIANIPRTWMQFSSGTIGNSSSNGTLRADEDTKSLFFFIWTTYSDQMAPLYDSTGVKVARGADAKTDFNANRAIQLLFNSGRVIGNVGLPDQVFGFGVDTGNDTVILTGAPLWSNYSLYQCRKVQVYVSGSGSLPTGLSASTDYYIIETGSVGIFKLATSVANARAGTAINITSGGSGELLLKVENDIDPLLNGFATGEIDHFQVTDELVPHVHGLSNDVNVVHDTGGGSSAPTGGTDFTTSDLAVQSTGGGDAFNIFQPTLWLPHIIKL